MTPDIDEPLDEEGRYLQALERAKAPDPEPVPDDPAAEQTEPTEPAPEAGSSVVEPEKAPAKFDLAALSPEVRAEFEKLQSERDRERHEKQALLGRVPRLQSELDRLRSQPRVSETPAQPAPPTVPAAQDSKAYFDSSEWKEYEGDFPKEAALQRKILEAAFARADKAERASQELLSKVDQRFGTVESFMQERVKERETHALSQAHPDWADLVHPKTQDDAVYIGNSPKGDPIFIDRTFHGWLSAQDEDKQKWFGSDSADKNIRLMDDYKRDLYLANLHATPEPPEARPPRRVPDIDPSPRARQTNPVSRHAGPVDPEEEAYVAALERIAASVR